MENAPFRTQTPFATQMNRSAILVLILASPLVPVWAIFPLLLAGEIAERYLFFRAVDAPKMPGVPA